jgi:hypothetical protein
MHDEFLNQRYGTFFFIAILDGIFFCSYGTIKTHIAFQSFIQFSSVGHALSLDSFFIRNFQKLAF